MEQLLIVEDDIGLNQGLCKALKADDRQIISCHDLKAAREQLLCGSVSLILLDINLPDGSGLELLREVKENMPGVPVILLTANDTDLDIVDGLERGADDYITKPFNPLELMARVKTQLRRYTRYNTAGVTQKQDEEIDIRGMHISNISHKCMLNGQEIALTPLEFDIVWYLARKRGKVVSSEELFEAVWKEKYLDNNNTVMAHIARIRDKMHETARKPKFIKTVWGVGYTIE